MTEEPKTDVGEVATAHAVEAPRTDLGDSPAADGADLQTTAPEGSAIESKP